LKRHFLLALTAIATAGGAFAQINGWTTIILHGKVEMDDGSAPPKMVVLERFCSDQVAPDNVAYTEKNGTYTWKMQFDVNDERRCTLQAVLTPYKSNRYVIPDLNAFSDPNLPLLILTVNGANAANVFDETTTTNEIYGGVSAKVPAAAEREWTRAQDFVRKGRWADAERSLKLATAAVPKFARGWEGLALVLERENKPTEAWKDYKLAIDADPKLLGSYLPLARLSVDVKDWDTASQVTEELIKRDTLKRYTEAHLIHAMACYQKKDYDCAVTSATETIKMDTKNRLPSAEELLGLSLAAKSDYDGARKHLDRYLELIPRPSNLEELKAYNANLGKTDATNGSAPEVVLGAAELPSAGVPGDAWVPGGRKALAQVVGLKDASTYENFFADYCRALAREMTVGTSQGIPGYLETVRAYMATITDLLPLGQRNGDVTTFMLSLATDNQRKASERILNLLGWKLVPKDGAYLVEPGDQAADGPRQRVPRLFGVDEINMQEALESGKSFQFDIPTENARVVGGNDWSPLLKELPSIPGGIAAAFTQDVRVARTYAGLGAMNPEAASAVIRAVGVRNLVLRDSDVMARFGDAFEITKDGVAVPGGAAAVPAWRKLVGANPADPAPFFRALAEKNEGRLAAFYFAVWSADKAHQAYLLKSEAQAEHFYAWYRDSEEMKFGLTRFVPGWRTEMLQKLPLDAAGNLNLPGGKHAWTASTGADDEVVLTLKTLEALVPLAQMEQRRKSPLDEASVTLLAQHYSEWRSLFPYFETLPSLGREDFAALQAFTVAVSKQPPASQNVVLGEWYSIVELIARGHQAGSLDAAATARAFRSACEGLSQEDHSAKAFASLREIAGGVNLDEAVPGNLLRLTAERRAAFQRILELQNVPLIDPQTRLTIPMGIPASYDVVVSSNSSAGETAIAAGAYKVTMEGDHAIFTTGKQAVPVAARLERSPSKFQGTTVESSGNKIQAIDLGGSDTRIVFTPAKTGANQNQPLPAAVLSRFVYAASVDPDGLLVSEDTQFLSRHQFTAPDADDKRPFAFAPAALVGSNTAPGSYLTGGFVNFQEVAHQFASGGRSVPPITLNTSAARNQAASLRSGPLLASAETGPNSADSPTADLVFHASGRLVEAYATVTDSNGHYVDNLTADQFTLLDGPQTQSLVAFESHSNPVSVALLLDTTGSMTAALPAVKSAALKLIGDLRPIDSVAVYSFNRTVTELQPYTSDLALAKRAVLSTHAEGETALYDALARVSRDLSGRSGKKVIVVFTDGDDNSSTLTMDTAILRVKASGIPVYTIAQGEAVETKCLTLEQCKNPPPPPAYVKQLADLAKVTGGESFAVKEPSEIGRVFEKVSEDLAHGYMLVFQPPAAEDHVVHPITVQVRVKGDKVRARESYYPE
jgi:Ca-activated chloride channel homolog